MSEVDTPVRKKTGPKPLPRKQCSVEGCESIAEHPVFGLCGKHYKRLQRHGSTESTRGEIGAGTVTAYGYKAITKKGRTKFEHTLIVEKAIGGPLPDGAEIHHINGNKLDNRPENLVVCPSRAYHKLLHVRADALAACGNPGFRKCPFCKKYDDPAQMRRNESSRYFFHAECRAEYGKKRRAK